MSKTPTPRPSVTAPDLGRPDWTKPENRNRNLLWLDKNENADPILAEVVRHVLAEIPAEALWSYPDSAALYAKLAKHVGVSPGNLLLAAGSDGIIRSVYEAFVGPGDVVIHTDPTFAMYGVYGQIYGADTRTIAYLPSNRGPRLPLDDLIRTIQESQPRLVCLPNPDSPTGTVVEPDDLHKVVVAAGEAGSVILIDEAYFPFYPRTLAGNVDRYPHLVIARSTGKAWGMAGLRIGYGIACTELARILHKVRPMYETSTVAVAAFERMLDYASEMEASVKRLQAGKRSFIEAMESLGFATNEGHGNFLHVAFADRADIVHAALADVAYYRKDFSQSCLRGFSRFSATTTERFEPVIARIRKAVGTSS